MGNRLLLAVFLAICGAFASACSLMGGPPGVGDPVKSDAGPGVLAGASHVAAVGATAAEATGTPWGAVAGLVLSGASIVLASLAKKSAAAAHDRIDAVPGAAPAPSPAAGGAGEPGGAPVAARGP